ncbi:MAG: MFS transporter [Planctomycetota bacterium]|jgi:MFS family permease|nr:MFS transporter [Planctomycetota bacterium]
MPESRRPAAIKKTLNWKTNLVGLGAGRFVFAFAVSGLASVLVVILGRLTSPARKGTVFGWSVTVRSLGWMFAPIAGAWAVGAFGWNRAFYIEAAVCFLLVPCFVYLGRRHKVAYPPEIDDPPSMAEVARSSASTPHLHGRVTD